MPEERDGLNGKTGSLEAMSIERSFWPRGIRILNNMEERFNMETNAKRTRDPLLKDTERKKNNCDRKKAGIDEDKIFFDVDSNDFDIGDLDSANDRTFQVSATLPCLFFWLCIANFSLSHNTGAAGQGFLESRQSHQEGKHQPTKVRSSDC